jgi:hypothetical protein
MKRRGKKFVALERAGKQKSGGNNLGRGANLPNRRSEVATRPET